MVDIPINSVDSRSEPLGNTFLNYEDNMLLLAKQRIFRAHSFAGYRPWRLREKTVTIAPQPYQQHQHPLQTQHVSENEQSLLEVQLSANEAMDHNTTHHSLSVGVSVEGEIRMENRDEGISSEMGNTKSVTHPEHEARVVEYHMVSKIDGDSGHADLGKVDFGNAGSEISGSGNVGQNLPSSRNAQDVHAPKTPCNILHHVTGDPVTTLVIQRLPRNILMPELLQDIDASGFSGLYDFCYMPCRFKPVMNLGSAFLNFQTPEAAWMFRECWQGTRRWDMRATQRGIGIALANAQGMQANLQRCYPRISRVQDKRFHPFVRHNTVGTYDDLPTTIDQPCHHIPPFKQSKADRQTT